MALERRSEPLSRRQRLLVFVLSLLAVPALAHRLSPAYLGLTENSAGVFDVEWKVSVPGGLADVLEPRIPDGCRLDGAVRTYAVGDARLQHGVMACESGLAGREISIGGLRATETDVLVRVAFADGSSFTHRLVPNAPSVTVPERAGFGIVVVTYLVLGIEHILLGIDHLLFVLALLLIVRGIGRLVATITAFTAAHSITLGAATLGIANLPEAPVEATIALSILFLATELARRSMRGADAPADMTTRYPWVVAFAFGLLHGFGFAGALAEVGLPQHAVPVALLFFNVGVEIGQLMFIAVVLAAAVAWRRAALSVPAEWPRAAAYAIGTVAAFWAIERSVAVFHS
jgi:hypothetical protein